MITSNVLQRTYRIKYGQSLGTCFTIEVGERQYLVTARHMVNSFPPADTIEIFYEKDWHKTSAKLVGTAAGEINITVLALD
ncbi:MAG: hypothetical protein ACRDRT_07495, partial [Pseudonocardiaceae bacterium]